MSSKAPSTRTSDAPVAAPGIARRRLGSLVRFLLVFIAIVAGSHLYFIDRLVVSPGWSEGLTATLWTAVTVLGALLFAMPFATRLLSPARARPLAIVGYIWMGVSFYLLLGLGTSDLGLWLTNTSGLAIAQTRAIVVTSVAALLALAGLTNALATPSVKRVEVTLPRWPEALSGYRIVQLSDIHIGALLQRGFVERVVNRCNDLRADLMAITGDIVDGRVEHLADHVAPLAQLRARHGVFAVTGNHDHYAGARAWVPHFEGLGLRVLRNEHTLIDDGGEHFILAGVDDRSASTDGDDVALAFATADSSKPRILLAHHPGTFEQATDHQVDLQLSGHTHGGQMWPFVYLVPLQTRWVAGTYREGHSQLYVSRGTGFWGPPMRLWAPAEITEIVLNRGEADA